MTRREKLGDFLRRTIALSNYPFEIIRRCFLPPSSSDSFRTFESIRPIQEEKREGCKINYSQKHTYRSNYSSFVGLLCDFSRGESRLMRGNIVLNYIFEKRVGFAFEKKIKKWRAPAAIRCDKYGTAGVRRGSATDICYRMTSFSPSTHLSFGVASRYGVHLPAHVPEYVLLP